MASPPAFTVHPSLAPWNITAAAFLAPTPFAPVRVNGVGTGVLVFCPSPTTAAAAAPSSAPPRVLLVRRALSDSMPGLWEVPGGAVDFDADTTIVAGAARELLEEAGLRATAFLAPIGQANEGQQQQQQRQEFEQQLQLQGKRPEVVFASRSGALIWAKITFLAEVAAEELPGEESGPLGRVRLDPDEHMDAAWAGEDEVRAGALADGREIPFTARSQRMTVLEGFRVWKEIAAAAVAEAGGHGELGG